MGEQRPPGSSGSTGLRGRISHHRGGVAADSWNLTWVMPAEERAVDAPTTFIVLTGGRTEEPFDAPLPHDAFVIAADSGLELAPVLGLEVDLIIGDMDSVDAASLADAMAAGAEVVRHPTDKDATDLEFALAAATKRGAERIIVTGGSGGRLDHLLANALALFSPQLEGVDVEWWTGRYRSVVVRASAELEGNPGDPVSLLPIGGGAKVVTTSGLRWELAGGDLDHGSSRGVSNEMTGPHVTISVGSGKLLAIHERIST